MKIRNIIFLAALAFAPGKAYPQTKPPAGIDWFGHDRRAITLEEAIRLRPEHKADLEDPAISCTDCHQDYKDFTSKDPRKLFVPFFYHSIHENAAACIVCHPTPGAMPTNEICSRCHVENETMGPHQVTMTTSKCTDCHAPVEKEPTLKQGLRQRHQTRKVQTPCGSCHTDVIGGTHQNRQNDWERDHNNSPLPRQLCFSCNQQKACVKCHLENRHSDEALDDHQSGFLMGERKCSACHSIAHKGCAKCHSQDHVQSNSTFKHYFDDPREAFRREGRKCVQCHQPNAAFEQAIRRRGSRE